MFKYALVLSWNQERSLAERRCLEVMCSLQGASVDFSWTLKNPRRGKKKLHGESTGGLFISKGDHVRSMKRLLWVIISFLIGVVSSSRMKATCLGHVASFYAFTLAFVATDLSPAACYKSRSPSLRLRRLMLIFRLIIWILQLKWPIHNINITSWFKFKWRKEVPQERGSTVYYRK